MSPISPYKRGLYWTVLAEGTELAHPIQRSRAGGGAQSQRSGVGLVAALGN